MSRFRTGFPSSFGGGYYGVPQDGLDDGTALQMLARFDPWRASQVAREQFDPIRQSMSRSQLLQQQEQERIRAEQEAVQQQWLERQRAIEAANLQEQARQAEFGRQSQLSAQSARQAQEQMIASNNLQVLNETGRALQARDDRNYRQRHPYLPGQSPGEQQDFRKSDFRDQQEWQMAQKRLDQDIRGEDQLETLRRSHESQGWTYSPEQQQMMERLDSQVGAAYQKLMSGEITKSQYAKYMELINRAKKETFPTQPPSPEQQSALFMTGNRAALPSSGSRSSGSRIGFGDLGKFDQDRYSGWLKSAEEEFRVAEDDYRTRSADPKNRGKLAEPKFEEFLKTRMNRLPQRLRGVFESEYLGDQGGDQGGNEVPQELGGITRPSATTGESVPTPMSESGLGGSRKGRYDAVARDPSIESGRIRSIRGSFDKMSDGSHPLLMKAIQAGLDPDEVDAMRSKIVELSAQYLETKDDEAWREIEQIANKLNVNPSLERRIANGGGVPSGLEALPEPRDGTSGLVGGAGMDADATDRRAEIFENVLPAGVSENDVLDLMGSGMSRDQAIEYIRSRIPMTRYRRSR